MSKLNDILTTLNEHNFVNVRKEVPHDSGCIVSFKCYYTPPKTKVGWDNVNKDAYISLDYNMDRNRLEKSAVVCEGEDVFCGSLEACIESFESKKENG